MNVAFLGLGAIGEPMAAHLAKDPFRLTVWNRTGSKSDEFASRHGVQSATSAAEAVDDAEFIITCVTSSREVDELVGQMEQSIRRGAMLIDCTSGDPATSRRIADRLADKGVSFIDAPVSGGVKGAVAGTLTIMCGGSPQNVERAMPVLQAFGKKIVRCGDVGAGDAVKAMNQALLAIHIWSGGEALAALARLGVPLGFGRGRLRCGLAWRLLLGGKWPGGAHHGQRPGNQKRCGGDGEAMSGVLIHGPEPGS